MTFGGAECGSWRVESVGHGASWVWRGRGEGSAGRVVLIVGGEEGAVVAYTAGRMPPACRTPGLGGEARRGEEDEEFDVDALGMQLAVATVRGSRGSSSLSFEGDGADDDSSGSADREAPKVLHVLAAVLDRLVARNEQFANAPSQQGKKLTIFHGLRAPSISVAKYLERIFKYTSCSPSCFVVGYVFLDRLIHRQPDLLVTSLNVHRLLVTSVMVATKMLDDV